MSVGMQALCYVCLFALSKTLDLLTLRLTIEYNFIKFSFRFKYRGLVKIDRAQVRPLSTPSNEPEFYG